MPWRADCPVDGRQENGWLPRTPACYGLVFGCDRQTYAVLTCYDIPQIWRYLHLHDRVHCTDARVDTHAVLARHSDPSLSEPLLVHDTLHRPRMRAMGAN
ncbi:hypothetical protein ONZ45_g8453 [Pleurotus djamor]|nr:hypothetical protein ONZ45_g8453 [Pleurotus djamor]